MSIFVIYKDVFEHEPEKTKNTFYPPEAACHNWLLTANSKCQKLTEVVLAERKRCLRTHRYTAALMATLRKKWFVALPNKCKSNETEVTSCLFTLPRCHHTNRTEKRGSVLSTLVNDLDFNIIASVRCVASFEHIWKVVCVTSFGLPNKLSTSNAWKCGIWMPCAELKTNDVLQLPTNLSAHEWSEPEVKEGLLKKKKS